MKNIHLAQLIFNRPLMIAESKLNVILHVLGPRMDLDLSGMPPIQAGVLSDEDRARSGYTVQDGIATIGIYGPLMNRVLRSEFPSGGPTTYANIRSAFDTALADDGVSEIKFDIDSPGGDSAGAFDLADHIYESRGIKPITAVVNESAYSAAYLLASAAGKITVPRTGGVGSIGVIMTHADLSRAENNAGITVTHIYAGARKADFSPHQPITAEALRSGQEMVNGTYDLFVQTVARNRNMSEAAVRGTEADIFKAKRAVEIGLADEVMPAAKAMKKSHSMGDMKMQPMRPSSVTGGNATAEIQKGEQRMSMTKVELKEKYPALYAEVFEEGNQVGMLAGAEAERSRIQSVLNLPGAAAQAHKSLITQLAFDGKTTAEGASFQVLQAEETLREQAAKDLQEGAVEPAPAASAEGGESKSAEQAEQKSLAEKMVALANAGR